MLSHHGTVRSVRALNSGMQTVELESQKASKLEDNFETLAENVRLFATTIEDALKRAKSDIKAASRDEQQELAQLQKDLKA